MTVLITGGSGLVGSKLTQILLNKGYKVVWLSRNAGIKQGITCFKWDYKNNYIDRNAFEGVTHIVHLAGAGVFDHKWSTSYKKEITDSRIKATEVLIEAASAYQAIKTWVCASAIGIYGNSMNAAPQFETSSLGSDFLAEVTKKWEAATSKVNKTNARLVQIRIGIVLAKEGGALPSMITPINYFIGSPLASGKQIISWIHIEDLCSILTKGLEDETMLGVYNAVSPNPVSNETFTKIAGSIMNKPLFMPHVPKFVLETILGKERAASVVEGISVSSQKIEQTAFKFKFPNLKEALNDLLKT
ncbi:TIGR01777 family oxidoreductase [uncultured Cytophaga sp.]|uniref:TIGR01777 family oxidoreductase n=1 Tax=uncultured Cytophaga sp. TaxID=160238 RepID=UPI002623E8CC|nr:TIGR01777 family oxidoreductase [uncultured Cytophaga sp.]